MNEFLEKHLEWIVGLFIAAIVGVVMKVISLTSWMTRTEMKMQTLKTDHGNVAKIVATNQSRASDVLRWIEKVDTLNETSKETARTLAHIVQSNNDRLIAVEQKLEGLADKVDDHFNRQNGSLDRLGNEVSSMQKNCLKRLETCKGLMKTNED